jgi:hypothetical protein
MIYRKAKAKETTLEEIRKHVSPSSNPIEFIDEKLLPFADAFFSIEKKFYKHTDEVKAKVVRELFGWLRYIDNFDWLPPAILYLSKHKSEPEKLVKFFADLERMAASMMFRHEGVNHRLQIYGSILAWIQEDKDLFDDSNSPLQLSELDQIETLMSLTDEIYTQKYAKYVLLRLDRVIATSEASYDVDVISLEHVLPQKPRPNSQWLENFTKSGQIFWVHRLANMVLLSHRKNSKAQNFDFKEKKEIYFKESAAPFALTHQVTTYDIWDDDTLHDRQKDIIRILAEVWRLQEASKEAIGWLDATRNITKTDIGAKITRTKYSPRAKQ